MKVVKRVATWLAAAMLCCSLGLVGCSTQDSDGANDEQGSSAETRIVADLDGNEYELPATIDSIVVPFPAATQAILGLGAADLLTGGYILDTDMNETMFGSYIEAITLISPSSLNQEVVMGCDPDFVVVASQSQADTLASVGVPLFLYQSSSIEDLMNSIDMIAEAIGTDEALERASAYRTFYDSIRSTVSAMTESIPDEEKPVVYVCTEDDGLSSHGLGGLINEYVTLSGGKYLCEELGVEGGEVSLTAEQIVAGDPDIIICVTTAGRDAILSNPAFANLSAVQNDQVYVNPLGGSVWFKAHFEAPLELAWLPTVISPDYTQDLDTRSYVDEFYETFYNYDVTDEDYELIMNPPVGSR